MPRIQRVDVGGAVDRIVNKYNIEQVLRSAGRPKKGGGPDFSIFYVSIPDSCYNYIH